MVWQSGVSLTPSGALPTALENPSIGDVPPSREAFVFAPPGVLITASGLQGVQPLVDRIM